MGTLNELLSIARKEIGYTENPPKSNMTKYGKWMGLNGYAWCLSYIQWVCNQAKVRLPAKTGSCGALMNAAKEANMWVVANFKPGDIVIFDFSGKQKTTQHCGIVEEILPDYGVQTIEGNTSVSGSQDNGGMVCRKTRADKYIIGAVRPVYEPEKAEQEDVSKMTINEFIEKLTDEQAYKLMSKAQRYAESLPEPEWSKNEGHWGKAVSKKFVNGGAPEGLIKRDEVVTLFGRVGLFDK